MLTVDKSSPAAGSGLQTTVFSPPFLGPRLVPMVLIEEIIGYVNRGDLFRRLWHIEPEPGESARDLAVRSLDFFQARMASARSQDLFEPKVAYGFFPVNSAGDDLIVWADDSRSSEQLRLPFRRRRDMPNGCVADFFKPVGEPDYAAIQVTTMGSRISSKTPLLYAGAIRETYVALHALAVAMLEAFSEYWHRRIRYEWGFGFEDGPSLNLLFDHFYRGERYALNGTSHMDASFLQPLIDLLDAGHIGVRANEAAIHPELTAVSLIAHDPQAVPIFAG